LARAVKRSGRRIRFRFGGERVRARMYRNFAQLREGWTKNLALLFESPLRLAVMRGAEFILITGGVLIVAVAGARREPTLGAAAGALAAGTWTMFLRRIRRAHFGWDANLLALFGLPVFVSLLLASRLSHKHGSITWKGRTYGATIRAASPADRGSPSFAAEARNSDAAAPGRI
jgi:high-affinity Fe2+/Pb2+ permease